MPKYTYLCKECDHCFEVFHSISEDQDGCIECSGLVARIPSTVNLVRNIDGTEKTGEITKRFIEEAKQDLKRERENIKQSEREA